MWELTESTGADTIALGTVTGSVPVEDALETIGGWPLSGAVGRHLAQTSRPANARVVWRMRTPQQVGKLDTELDDQSAESPDEEALTYGLTHGVLLSV